MEPSSTSNSSSPTTTRQCFALIVGIDQYTSPSIRDLQGCKNDAQNFKNVLMSHPELRVPEENIRLLTDTDATRQCILDAFQAHLISNERICAGDALVFYFAGHGSRSVCLNTVVAPTGYVQTICPHDERQLYGSEFTYGIPHYTLHNLIQKLAASAAKGDEIKLAAAAKGSNINLAPPAKGNNIIIILDSCHSEGTSRAVIPPNARCCEADIKHPIPANLDIEFFPKTGSGRHVEEHIPDGFIYKHMQSHVLLAACKADQFAGEEEIVEASSCRSWQGRFTERLVRNLREARFGQLTYRELHRLIGNWPKEQDPQVEGKSQGCLLFETHEPATEPEYCVVAIKGKAGKFNVGAGAALGIVLGTRFGVRDGEGKQVVVLVATDVRDFDSTATVDGEAQLFEGQPIGWMASVLNWKHGMMKLFLADDLDPDAKAAIHDTSDGIPHKYVLVASKEDADTQLLKVGEGVFVLIRCKGVVKDHNLKPTEFSLDRTQFSRFRNILNAIADFDYYLNLSSDRKLEVDLEVHSLTGSHLSGATPSANLFQERYVCLHADETKYGFTVTNTSPYKLFAHLVYFNPMDYSISILDGPPAPSADPPLPPPYLGQQSRLAMGYGRGVPGFQFTVPAGKTKVTEFMKVFVATQYIDRHPMEQVSPFDPNFRPKRTVTRVQEPLDTWDAFYCTVDVKVPAEAA
ncbi:hypothetical protein MVEN_02256500 [Mycena venus]|uniref:Peptidase C14 caspase domain-containing protein n=1 Tax=Mycena venus TaxID=2733690 RepID=A0A8H6X6N8_9AGAR|nr:hypothetical protein MVEN_02256500 [Mycena venus]